MLSVVYKYLHLTTRANKSHMRVLRVPSVFESVLGTRRSHAGTCCHMPARVRACQHVPARVCACHGGTSSSAKTAMRSADVTVCDVGKILLMSSGMELE